MNHKPITNRIYLPGLDALRFFAAFAVIVAHIELLKQQLDVENNYEFILRLNLGGLGVYFFFVLSGFLITYLLMHEKERTGAIAIKKFYIRRLLRIWPLYYFVTLLGMFVLPHFEMMNIPWLQQFYEPNWNSNLILFLLMLPNVALAFMPAVPHIGQLWSIGVEEQFYLLWPVLFSKAKKVLVLILAGIFVILSLKVVYILALKWNWLPSNDWTSGFKKLIAMSKFECMLIGAYGAYLLKTQKKQWLKIIYHPATLLITLLLMPFVSYYCPDALDDIVHLPYALLFLVVILNVSSNPKSFLKLETKIFNFLGQISYGLYMYHMMVVVFVIQITKKFFEGGTIGFDIVVYLGAITLSILVAYLSYQFFEKPFLKLKEKFTIVSSGKI